MASCMVVNVFCRLNRYKIVQYYHFTFWCWLNTVNIFQIQSFLLSDVSVNILCWFSFRESFGALDLRGVERVWIPTLPLTSCVAWTSYLISLVSFFVCICKINPPAMQEMWVQFLGQEDQLEKATHSSCLGYSMGRRAWWSIVHGVWKESNMT